MGWGHPTEQRKVELWATKELSCVRASGDPHFLLPYMGWAFKSKHNTIIFTEELVSFLESKRNQRKGEKSTKTADAEVNKKLYAIPEEIMFFKPKYREFFVAYIIFCFIYPNFLFLSERSVVLGKKKTTSAGNCSRTCELVVHKNN